MQYYDVLSHNDLPVDDVDNNLGCMCLIWDRYGDYSDKRDLERCMHSLLWTVFEDLLISYDLGILRRFYTITELTKILHNHVP